MALVKGGLRALRSLNNSSVLFHVYILGASGPYTGSYLNTRKSGAAAELMTDVPSAIAITYDASKDLALPDLVLIPCRGTVKHRRSCAININLKISNMGIYITTSIKGVSTYLF